MRTMKFLLQKEFRQIFRNPTILAMIILAPMVQLVILPLAADYEIKNINVAIVDDDRSTYSQRLANEINASHYFKLAGYTPSYSEAYLLFERDKADLILQIPAGFERNLVRDNRQQVFLAVNAINGTKATIGSTYIVQLLSGFNNNIRLEFMKQPSLDMPGAIGIVPAFWFNPHMNYRLFIVPGILVLLVTMISGYMCALNIVKEKEVGTIDQINVTPIKKYHFILGKLVPFWIMGVIVFTIGLFGVARLVYGIVPVGNILLLYAFLAVYLLGIVGWGLLISTYCTTQQQAMSLAFFFVMIFILMSGFFTPIESMPQWAQWIARVNPVTYFIDVQRKVILKGSGFADIKSDFLVAAVFALVFNGWAILNYRKTG